MMTGVLCPFAAWIALDRMHCRAVRMNWLMNADFLATCA
jgi:hypothetical protein